MSSMSTVLTLSEVAHVLFLFNAAVMFTMSVVLVYTVLAYARNVAYTEGIVLLALSFLSVAVVILLDFFLEMGTLANAVRLSGSCFALAGVWFFARDFVRVGTDSGYMDIGKEGFDDRDD